MTETDETPVETETTTEDDGGDLTTYVHTSVIMVNGLNHTASCSFPGEASDEELAAALVRVASAAAQLHSSGAWMALQRLLAEPGGGR